MLPLRQGLCKQKCGNELFLPFNIDLPPTQKPVMQFPPVPLMTQMPKVLSLKTWIYLCFFLHVGWMIHFVPWRCFQPQNCYIKAFRPSAFHWALEISCALSPRPRWSEVQNDFESGVSNPHRVFFIFVLFFPLKYTFWYFKFIPLQNSVFLS